MNINLFYYGVPILLCLVGFHGVFFHASLAKKTISWCALQAGLVVFLVGLAPAGHALPLSLTLLTVGITLAVGTLLAAYCLKFWKKHKTLHGGNIARRYSK